MHSITRKILEDSFTIVPLTVDRPANPRPGGSMGTATALGREGHAHGLLTDDIGSAQDRRRLRHRAQVDALVRRLRTAAGVGLVGAGVLLVFAAALTLAARALPLSWLLRRPATWSGTGLIVAGLLLALARPRRRVF